MLVFLWMCVATAAFMPNGDRVVTYYTAAMEDYFDNMLGEEPAPKYARAAPALPAMAKERNRAARPRALAAAR